MRVHRVGSQRLLGSNALLRLASESTTSSTFIHSSSCRSGTASITPLARDSRTSVSLNGTLDPYLRNRGRFRKRASDIAWQRRMLRSAACAVMASSREEEMARDVLPDYVPRVIIPQPVDLAPFASLPHGELFREGCLGGRSGRIILNVGRLAAVKGLDLLVAAFAQIAGSADCELVLAGPDDEGLAESLGRMASKLDVAGRVLFPGMLTGELKLSALSAATIWALPSHAENFGVAVVEALAAGLPTVVSSSVGIARDAVAAEAVLAVASEPQSLAGALRRLLNDPGERARLRERSRVFVRRYDRAVVGHQLAAAYAQIVARRRPPSDAARGNTMTDGVPISVIVLTRNEEANLRDCLQSVSTFAEVFVVDSKSSDRTSEIAQECGAQVVEFEWDGGYPKKKQWSLEHLPFTFDWVLLLDADERVTPELVAEIRRVVENPAFAGYFVSLDYRFLGRTLRHGQRVHKLILFDRTRGHFEEQDDLEASNMWEVEGHYQPRIAGSVGRLQAPLLHDDHDSLYRYFERHNRYSDWEATLRRMPSSGRVSSTALNSRAKRLFEALPFRSAAFFTYAYILSRRVPRRSCWLPLCAGEGLLLLADPSQGTRARRAPVSVHRYYQEYWSREEGSLLADPLSSTRLALLRAELGRDDRRVLDVGTGPGTVVGELSSIGYTAIGFDISQRAIELASARYPTSTFFQHAVEDLPWPVEASSQDAVVAFEVIEHLLRPRSLLDGARESLRVGGHLALTTPYHGLLKNIVVSLVAFDRHFAPEGDHIRFFSDRALRRLLSSAGFEVERVRHFGRVAGLWAGVFVWARKM